MPFPLEMKFHIEVGNVSEARSVTLYDGLTVLLGPNGSGKTQLLRGLRSSLNSLYSGKHARFLSAGRVGLIEQFRSDFNGQRHGTPDYDSAAYGNKQETARRHRAETLQGDFQTLSVRPDILIKIRERLRKLFLREIRIHWDSGQLKIEFSRTSGQEPEYSSAREASGLLHLVGLLTALYDDETAAILIDEPEVSLHPQLQAFLLKEILGVAGEPNAESNKKIVIIATHSTEFLRIESVRDINRLVFCSDLRRAPVQVPADAPELKNTKLASLVARMGQEHKLSFFAHAPLLVEGTSDSIICAALSSKFGISIEAGGSQLLPVMGKGEFPVVVKLLRLTGKSPLVLADADGLIDGLELANTFLLSHDATTRAARIGSGSAIDLSRTVLNAFYDLVANHWGDIAPTAESHYYWVCRNEGSDGEISAKRRSAFASLFLLPDNAVASLGDGGRWSQIKARLEVLLDLLESQGCFFLRKGTIESYYLKLDGKPSVGKPATAVAETAQFEEVANEVLQDRFSDVIRCLRSAAKVSPIVEAELLRDALLAIVAPALARLKDGAAVESLNALAWSTVGELAGLFELSYAAEKLNVKLLSKVLTVEGFPMEIALDDDVVKRVSSALGLSHPKQVTPLAK